MKLHVYYLLILTLFTIACSETNTLPEDPLEQEQRTIYLKLNTPVQTRLDREPSQSDRAATVYTAILYFLDNTPDPICRAVRTVGAGSADATIEQLKEGVFLEGIPGDVSQVYVVGNWNSADSLGNYADFPQIVGVPLSTIKSTVLDINQVAYWRLADGTSTGNSTAPGQNNTVYKIAVMDALAQIREYGTAPDEWEGGAGPVAGDLYAGFTLTPVVARLEWQVMLLALNSNIYTMDGVYINNYYQKLPLSLNTDGFSITHNGDEPASYTPDDPLFAYTNYRAMYNPFYYNCNTNDNSDVVFSAGDGNVFAFHTFGNTPPPQLVIRFTNLYYRSAPNTLVPEGYAVVRFRDQNNNEITLFERNKIYKPYQYINDVYGVANGFVVPANPVLPPTPDPPPTVDIFITLEVLDWVDVGITSVI